MQKYKVLAFDIDDTLVDDVAAIKYAISQVYEHLHIISTEENMLQYVHFDEYFWKRFQENKIVVPKELPTDWATYLRALRFVEFFKDKSVSLEEGILLNDIYMSHLGDCIQPLPNVRETLEFLQKYYKLLRYIDNGVLKGIIT